LSDLSPWRVEWLRLVRTRRLLALAATFVIFSFIGPLVARYLPDLLKNSTGSGVKIIVSKPVPADAIQGYANNALLIGLFVMMVVAASAFAVDARTALSIYYRSRVTSFWRLLLPRVAVAACAGIAAWLLGLAVAWYETRALIGAPDAKAMGEAAALVSVYLLFAIAVTAVASVITRSTTSSAISAISFILLVQILSAIPQLTQWVPYGLTGAPNALVRNTSGFSHYDRALIVCIVATIGLLAVVPVLGARREVSDQ
jgi:ABC-2 type transport system permease protein